MLHFAFDGRACKPESISCVTAMGHCLLERVVTEEDLGAKGTEEEFVGLCSRRTNENTWCSKQC